ncbi:hypothetical protein AU509_02970 [Lonsdalea britannica]|nr:hypothetical protein AU509_02970 [Lonsdalea britannica]
MSAFTGKHATGELGQLMQDIGNGSIAAGDMVLIESLDRLSREDISTATDRLKAILIHHVDVVTLSDGKHYTHESLNNPMDLIMSILTAQRAHQESEEKSRRMRQVWANKRAEAESQGKVISKSCPRWLTVKDDRTGFDIVPEHAQTIRQVFSLRIKGESLSSIAKTLNEEGRLTFTGRVGKWNQSTVQQLVSNKALIGYKVQSRKSVVNHPDIPDYYPVVVDLQTFQAVQQLKSDQFGKKQTSNIPALVNLFKSIIRCKKCGNIFILNSVTVNRDGYYVCSMRRQGRCDAKPIKRKDTDDMLVKGLFHNLDRLLLSKPEENPVSALEAQKQDLTERLTKLVSALEIAPDITEITSRMSVIQGELQSIEAQIKGHRQRVQSHVSDTVKCLNLLNKADRVEFQLIMKRHVKAIMVDTLKRTADIYFHSGLRLFNYPLDRLVDGEHFLEVLPVIDADEFDFNTYRVIG